MTLLYPLRLLCLCLATFFLVHLALGLATWLLAPAAIRLARRLHPGTAARLLLGLRLFPMAGSVLLVAGLCVPSYLWLEPRAAAEEAGFACLAAALMAGAIWAISIARALRASARSLRYIRRCRRLGRPTHLLGELSPVWVIPVKGIDDAPLSLVLAGIVRPRVFVSRVVVDALSTEQLAAALRHERAHRTSRDNLKRLLLLLAPDLFPFSRRFAALERAWVKFAEWAADDGAVAGDPLRSLSLAAALVRVARLSPAPQSSLLVTCLLDHHADLSARVERLLRAVPPDEESARAIPIVAASATVAAIVSAIVAMLQPATLDTAHRLLEHLMR